MAVITETKPNTAAPATSLTTPRAELPQITITAKRPPDASTSPSTNPPVPDPQPAPTPSATTNKPPETTSQGPGSPPDHDHSDPPPSPKTPREPVAVRPEAFEDLLNSKIERNLLNDYYSPTYHFRLFIAGDADPIKQANDPKSIADFISALSDKHIEQITIAESGVTGFTIKDVEIETVNTVNGLTSEQMALRMTITIVEPLGISFLDGFFGAAKALKIKNYAQTHYYLELTFTGYNEDGTPTGRPIKFPYANGGRWIWSFKPQKIETKINEGGGTYTLTCVTPQGEAAVMTNETKKLTQGPQTLTVSGETLGQLFNDYAEKLTKTWNDAYSKNNKKLRTYKIEVLEVPWGPHKGVNISTFHTLSTTPDKNSKKMLALDGKKLTAQVPVGKAVNDFIRDAIASTEEGQALIKDLTVQGNTSQTGTTVNDRNMLQATAFSIEVDPEKVGYDDITGNYIYDITIFVVPKPTPPNAVIMNTVQVEKARDPTVQRQMINSVVNAGLLRKKYEYIFTGKNTEVIEFNIDLNLPWQAMLPKLAGARLGYNNEALNDRLNELNIKGDTVQSEPDQQVAPRPISSTIGPAVTRVDPGPNDVAKPPLTPAALHEAGRQQFWGWLGNPFGIGKAKDTRDPWQIAGLTMPKYTQDPWQLAGLTMPTYVQDPWQLVGLETPDVRPSNIEPVKYSEANNNIYVEDLLDRVNQDDKFKLGDLPIPISFWQGYHIPEELAAKGFIGQWGRDQSLVGAIFAQMYDITPTGSFQKLDPLVIRGDPFWLGQSNLERQLRLRKHLEIYDPLEPPDHATHNKVIYLYFRYPLQIGSDTFQPILKPSESFNGLYEILTTKHSFNDGVYKTELRGKRLVLFNVEAAKTGDATSSSSTSSGAGSSSQLAATGGSGGNKGVTPGPGHGFTMTPTNLPDSTAKQTAIQSSDQTTITSTSGTALSATQLANYKAAISFKESTNDPTKNNGQGFVGQYQMGHDALQDTEYVYPGGNKQDPMSWTWTGKNGITSLSDWLANANIQNSAMNDFTQKNYDALVKKGAITSSTSSETVSGLLGAAHISGAGGAAQWAQTQGAYNPSDRFGTDTTTYYNLGYNATRLTPTQTASK